MTDPLPRPFLLPEHFAGRLGYAPWPWPTSHITRARPGVASRSVV
jgi:hypothetical protein